MLRPRLPVPVRHAHLHVHLHGLPVLARLFHRTRWVEVERGHVVVIYRCAVCGREKITLAKGN
jgi:hypothetical protein